MIYVVEMAVGDFRSADYAEARAWNVAHPGSSMYTEVVA